MDKPHSGTELACRSGQEPDHKGKHYYSRGGIRHALLKLLARKPMHGYQMIKALEEQSGGVYTPSAGSIYPVLQTLERQGLIECAASGGKKIYNLTETGNAAVRQLPRNSGPCESDAFGYRHTDHVREKIKRKLRIGDGVYRVLVQLANAERQAAALPGGEARLQLLLSRIGSELDAYTAEAAYGTQASGVERRHGSGPQSEPPVQWGRSNDDSVPRRTNG